MKTFATKCILALLLMLWTEKKKQMSVKKIVFLICYLNNNLYGTIKKNSRHNYRYLSFKVPHCNKKTQEQRAFSYIVPVTWNN